MTEKLLLLTFLIVSIFSISFSLFSEEENNKELDSAFISEFKQKVLVSLSNLKDIQGVSSEDVDVLRKDIANKINDLFENRVLQIQGTDKEIRPAFVTIQALIEDTLAKELGGAISDVQCCIHTPMPATPFCTKGEISPELLHPSIENDPQRLFTVKARTTILRDLLFKGTEIYIIYPEAGLARRTEEQQKIYRSELENYSKHLHDFPLKCEAIPEEFIGATYLIMTPEGSKCVFSIRMTQANDPREIGSFSLWFGSRYDEVVAERFDILFEFVNKYKINN